MKPEPDADEPSEIEAPMTRGLYATELDELASIPAADPENTLEDKTRRMPAADASTPPAPSPSSAPGSGSAINEGAFSAWSGGSSSPGPASGRGIYGKIRPDQTLYSKYRVLRQLGSGAMGEVWLVRHATLKSEHALKVIIPNFAKNAVALMRFQREFEVMASLRHEHAVTIYDASIDDEGGYIDMEYVEGQTIHEILNAARNRPGRLLTEPLMPLDWVVRVLDQLCEVLQVAHQKGIVHRDLKPSNMMLLGGRKPGKEYLKVLDFGIAKVRDDPESASGRNPEDGENKTLGFIGTPSYGSPEQAMARDDVDGRSDLYSVGIMLYEFLTGKLPFRGNHWQVMTLNATAPPPSFLETNPRLRPLPELEHAVLRVLAKDPAGRPQTARELFEEFREAAEAIRPSGSTTYVDATETDAHPVASHIPPTLFPTDHDGPISSGSPSTQMATLVAEPRPPEVSKPPPEAPSDLGTIAGAAGPRSSIGPKIGLAAGLLVVAVAGLMLAYSTRRAPSKPGESAPPSIVVATPPVAKKGPSFEAYWPAEFVRVSNDGADELWPDKVRRTTDQVYFNKIGEGIYLPDEYEVVDPKDLASDGWPRMIARDGIRFVRIPGGQEWVMGAWDALPDAVRPDAPAHPVVLSGFYMQETEVTNGQFEDYFLKNKSDSPRPPDWDQVYGTLKRKKVGAADARLHPAVNISRILALGFAEEMKGQLPSEAQWEYAARSCGKNHPYVWGRLPAPSRKEANIDSDSSTTTAPVGSYPSDRTAQGLLDLNGNVQEMCRDAYEAYRKTDRAALDPCQLPTRPLDAEYVIRGASYSSISGEFSVTRREDRKKADEFSENLGFRLVVECPDTRKPR